MFEVIGILVVGFIVWSVGKGLVRGAAHNTRMKSADFACEQGVPREFAMEMVDLNNYSLLKAARESYVANNPDARMQDVYVQHGLAILTVYNAQSAKGGK